MLEEVSNAITKVATDFSGFERDYSANVLQDLDQIFDAVLQLQEKPTKDAERFEQQYKAAIRRQLDRMEIFGLPRMDDNTRQQSLSVAYICLDASHQGASGVVKRLKEEDRFYAELEKAHHAEIDRDELKTLEREERISGPIDRILAESRKVVIRGQAGSGKSTLLQWIAVRSAHGDFPPHLASWNNSVPFFIRLREYVGQEFPKPEIFPEKLAGMVVGDMPAGWVHEQFKTGRAVLMVDGVDELPSKQRPAMLEALQQLVDTYPLARYILTSRPAAIKVEHWPDWQAWIEETKFADATLQAMDISHIDSFIDHWHKALHRTIVDPADRQEIEENPDLLKKLLRDRPDLRRLASSPLLCSMICALYRGRQRNLPSDRNKLYEECVEMLLDRREKGRKIDLGEDYPDLAYKQKLSLVQKFAYWLMSNGYSDVTTEEADDHFENNLPVMRLEDVTGEGVRRYFVERTNLLREPVTGRIDFTHRTFQEFLAAQAAVRNNNIGVLLKNSSDDQWRETIILAVGEARPKESEKIIRGLIKPSFRKIASKEERMRGSLLAMGCLETAVELPPELRSLVVQKAKALFFSEYPVACYEGSEH